MPKELKIGNLVFDIKENPIGKTQHTSLFWLFLYPEKRKSEFENPTLKIEKIDPSRNGIKVGDELKVSINDRMDDAVKFVIIQYRLC